MNRRKFLLMMMGGKAAIQYLLADEYINAIATGSVNNSLATPGPGTRNPVTDTESKLSIIAGEQVISGPKATPAWGDPGELYDSKARIPGEILLAHFKWNSSSAGYGPIIGWATNTTPGIPQGHSIYARTGSSGLYIDDNYAQEFALGIVPVSLLDYQVAVILRSTGCFYYIKGGTITTWTLVWVSNLNSTTPLYPAIVNKGAIYNNGYCYVPKNLWLPTPITSDGFGTSGQTDGLGHVEGIATGLGSGGAGLSWTGITWSLSGGKVLNTPNLGSELATGNLVVGTWYNITASETDHFYTGSAVGDTFRALDATALDANNKVKSLTLSELFYTCPQNTIDLFANVTEVAWTTGKQAGLILRADSISNPQNFILIYRTTGNLIKVIECVSGVYSADKISFSNIYAASKKIRVQLIGSAIRVYMVTSAGAVTLAGATTTSVLVGTLHGLFSTDSGNIFDDYITYPMTTTVFDNYAQVKSRTGSVAITFDDSMASTYSVAYPYMAGKGMIGTAYVVTDWLTGETHMTWAQLQEMDVAGWSIANHTKDHTNLTTLAEAQQEAELSDAKAALDAHSLTKAGMHVAYPYGANNADTLTAMAATGMLTGRTTGTTNFNYATTLYYQIPYYGVLNTMTAAILYPRVLEALTIGRVLIFGFHDLVASPSIQTEFAITEFQAFIDLLAAKGIAPITINQLYTKMFGAR